MSYTQFGYTYPSSSQILVSSPHPMSVSPCCPASGPGSAVADPSGGGAGETRLLSPFPRLTPAGFGLYGYAADHHLTSALSGSAPSAFYPSLPSPYDLKDSRSSWSALQPSSATTCYSYDPSGLATCGPYGDRYSTIDSVARRKNATRETTNTLKAWLYEHRKNPYPTKGEKIMLAIITKMTLTQVSTWFANARRRLKKENKMTWEPRNKTSEGDDRDSSSPRDNKSDDNTNEEDSNLTPAGVTNIDFLKQESEGFTNKHSFSEYDDPTLESKTNKNCTSYGINCYRTQSSEDSGTSSSPSPARPLQIPCYGDVATQRFDSKKSERKDPVYCDTFGPRPKIWSLARTATSNSPPLIRKYQCPTDYCLEGDPKESNGSDCAKIKTAGYGCPVPYSEFAQDRTSSAPSRKNAAEGVCCDRPMYGNMLPSCGVPPTKCETADCLRLSDRNQCMIKNQCSYAADYPPRMNNGTEHYSQFKSKDLCAIEYSTTKCQPLDSSVDDQTTKKLTSTMMAYPGSDPGRSSDFFNAGNGFDQVQPTIGTLHKGVSNQSGIDISESGPLLRRNDQ